MIIENNEECLVQLWQQLERTRVLLGAQGKRFCIRNIVRSWHQQGILHWQQAQLDLPNCKMRKILSYDEYLWEVCRLSNLDGWEVLPPPNLHPKKAQDLLRVLVAKEMRLGLRLVASFQSITRLES